MKAARGILTARGGMTEPRRRRRARHGQALRRRLLGARRSTPSRRRSLDDRRPTSSREGDVITIDGGTGHVYPGAVPHGAAALTGEFGELIGLGRRACAR